MRNISVRYSIFEEYVSILMYCTLTFTSLPITFLYRNLHRVVVLTVTYGSRLDDIEVVSRPLFVVQLQPPRQFALRFSSSSIRG